MRERVTVRLADPVQAHGETISELVLRPMIGKDLRACGYPFRMEGKVQIIDADVIARLSSELAGVPTSTIDQLSASDFQELVPAVLGFLGARAPTSSTDISSAAPSGATSST